MKNILLVSVETWDSMAEIPFMLKSGGCSTVDVLCPPEAWLNANRYFDKWIAVKTDPTEVQQQLIDIASDPQSPYEKIILLDDKVIKIMTECELTIEQFVKIMPLSKPENREMLASKSGFSNICEKYNIATPRYVVYQKNIPLADQVRELHFPLILKEDLSWGGGGINLCNDWAEFVDAMDHKVNVKHNLLIQEYIIGIDIGVEALYCNGQLVTYNASEVLAYFDNKFTFTCRRKYYRDPRIESLLEELGQNLGLLCFASISYIYHPGRDIYYLIEADTRTNMWMPASRFTGFDFAEGIQRILANWPNSIPKNTTLPDKTVEVALFYRDLRRCFKKKDWIGFLQWAVNYKGYWRFIPWYDPTLFKHMLIKILNDAVNKIHPIQKSIIRKNLGLIPRGTVVDGAFQNT